MLLQQITKLRQKRSKAIADGRALHERATKENRSLNTEESSQWDNLMKDVQTGGDEIKRLERQLDLEREIEGTSERDLSNGNGGGNEDPDQGVQLAKRTQAAFQKFLRGGLTVLNDTEKRDLSVGSGPDGGFTVAPVQWVNDLIKSVDDQCFIRGLATKQTITSSESLGAPSLDADPSDADWTSEIATGSKDAAMKFGKRELKPSPIAKRVLISNKLLRISGQPIEGLVRSRLAYKFAITEEKAFMTGNGVGKALGVFTADANGITTGRDVVCGGTTAPTGDGLIAMKFKLKAAYWNKAQWIFHRDTMAQIAILKASGDGQYVFRESLRAGEPDTLLGRPINLSEYAPNTLTTGQYVGMLGDFSNYWIVDALDMQVQRLVELYAETNQTGYIGRQEVDGMPVLEEAFVRGKLG